MSLANALPEICDQTVDMPWVSVEPISGTTLGGASSEIGVTFDSTGFNPGDVADWKPVRHKQRSGYLAGRCSFDDDGGDPGRRYLAPGADS